MYTVLEFQGIKFTSRSFQLEVALKQVLLVSNVPIFQSCVIRKPAAATPTATATATTAATAPLANDAMPMPDPEPPNLSQHAHDDDHDDNDDDDSPTQDEPENSPAQMHAVDSPANAITTMQPMQPMQPMQLQEINLDGLEELEHMHLKLKKPTEVYYNLYRIAKQKAKELKKNAIAAHLEAQQIKSAHMLDDSESDSDDSDASNNDSDNDHANDNVEVGKPKP
jgi:hypothetical protein